MSNLLLRKSILSFLAIAFFVMAGLGAFARVTNAFTAEDGYAYAYASPTTFSNVNYYSLFNATNVTAYNKLLTTEFGSAFQVKVDQALKKYFEDSTGTGNTDFVALNDWVNAYKLTLSCQGHLQSGFSYIGCTSANNTAAALTTAKTGLGQALNLFVGSVNAEAASEISTQQGKLDDILKDTRAAAVNTAYTSCKTAAGSDAEKLKDCEKDKCAALNPDSEQQKNACITSIATAGTLGEAQSGAEAITASSTEAQGEIVAGGDAAVVSNTTSQTGTIKTVPALQATTEEAAIMGSLKACPTWMGIPDIVCAYSRLPYYYLYLPASWLLWISGYIFDATITLSIDKFYVDQQFVTDTWTVIRDFSNMIFIFILLYTGIMTIFGQIDWRKTVINIVIIALIINFSLFFTKVVIDAGNILAVGIFQAMGVEKGSEGMLKSEPNRIKERNLSQAIVANFQPAKFLSRASAADNGDAAVIFIIAAIVNCFAAYILFKAAMLFIGRLLAFWFLMIISPFALISITMPKGNIFDWWWRTLVDQAFVAPVFLFLLYLLMKIIATSDLITGFSGAPGTTVGNFLFAKLLGPILVAIMLLLALQQILSITEGMAGEMGKMAQKYAGMVAGTAATVALGVATGGASVAMRGTVGAAASAIGKSETLAGLATSDRAGVLGKAKRWAGRAGQNIMDRGATASFDPRQIGAEGGVIGGFAGKYLNKGLSQFGIDVKKGAGAMGVKSGKGGYTAESERRQQAEDDKDAKGAERLEVTEGEKPKVIAEKTKEEREDIAIATQREAKEEDFVRTARAEKKDAEEKAQNSGAEQRVSGATTNVATQKAAADKARENLEKMKQSTTATDAMKNDAEQELRKAEQVLQGAEQEMEAAQNAPERLAERAEVQKAADKLARAEKQLEQAEAATKKATEILAEAEKTAVGRENERRREQYARNTDQSTRSSRVRRAAHAVGGAMLGGVTAGPVGAVAGAAGAYVVRTEANEERVARIRAGRSQKQKDEAKERATGEGKKAAEKEKTLRDLKKEREDAIKDGASEGDAVIKHIDKRIKKAEEGE